MESFQDLKPAKVEKAAKETKGMFQSMIGASSMGSVQAIMKLIEQIKPLMAIINIFEGLMKLLAGEAFKPLIEVLKPVYDIIISFMPLFAALGKIIGVLMSFALTPLIAVFKLLDIFLTPLIPYIEDFADLMDELMIYIDPLVDLIELGLIAAIEWLGEAIENLIGWFKDLGDAIGGWWEDLWGGVGDWWGDLWGGVGDWWEDLWSFQHGTDYVPHTGPYILHEGEKVSTAYESREMIGLLQEISNSNRRILKDKEFRHR